MPLQQLTQPLYDKLYADLLQFRQTFALPVASPGSLDAAQDKLHDSLIIEELTELAQAQDKVAQADAIVDSAYVLMGRLVHLGATEIDQHHSVVYLLELLLQVAANLQINFTACWDEVHRSNMSKLCQNEQQLADTIAHYAQQGIEIRAQRYQHYFIAVCAKDTYLPGKTIRQGKVLKSVYYRPAALANLVTAASPSVKAD